MRGDVATHRHRCCRVVFLPDVVALAQHVGHELRGNSLTSAVGHPSPDTLLDTCGHRRRSGRGLAGWGSGPGKLDSQLGELMPQRPLAASSRKASSQTGRSLPSQSVPSGRQELLGVGDQNQCQTSLMSQTRKVATPKGGSRYNTQVPGIWRLVMHSSLSLVPSLRRWP